MIILKIIFFILFSSNLFAQTNCDQTTITKQPGAVINFSAYSPVFKDIKIKGAFKFSEKFECMLYEDNIRSSSDTVYSTDSIENSDIVTTANFPKAVKPFVKKGLPVLSMSIQSENKDNLGKIVKIRLPVKVSSKNKKYRDFTFTVRNQKSTLDDFIFDSVKIEVNFLKKTITNLIFVNSKTGEIKNIAF